MKHLRSAFVQISASAAGAAILSALYQDFIAAIGHSFTDTSRAFWAMVLVCFTLGLLFAKPAAHPPPRGAHLAVAAVLAALLVRSSPEGFLLFGVTSTANNWVPPVLAVFLGLTAARAMARK